MRGGRGRKEGERRGDVRRGGEGREGEGRGGERRREGRDELNYITSMYVAR